MFLSRLLSWIDVNLDLSNFVVIKNVISDLSVSCSSGHTICMRLYLPPGYFKGNLIETCSALRWCLAHITVIHGLSYLVHPAVSYECLLSGVEFYFLDLSAFFPSFWFFLSSLYLHFMILCKPKCCPPAALSHPCS